MPAPFTQALGTKEESTLNSNPYAPPEAAVSDINQLNPAPELWNPNAAANWSLLFSPAFGAFLHMKNWQALGETQRAQLNRNWAIASVLIIFGAGFLSALLPESKALDSSTRLIGFALLVAWYMTSAKVQAKFVKDRFGSAYPRRGWGLPILAAIGCFAAVVVVAVVIAVIASP